MDRMIECIANNDVDPKAFDYASSYLKSTLYAFVSTIHMDELYLANSYFPNWMTQTHHVSKATLVSPLI